MSDDTPAPEWGPKETVPPAQLAGAAGLQDWRHVLDRLVTSFSTGDFSTGVRLVQRVDEIADQLNHHPDVDLRFPTVEVRTISHDVGAITGRDVALARQVSQAAQELGIEADPARCSAFELAVDALDIEGVRPFWAAVLGYAVASEGSLADPSGRLSGVWFQQMDAPRPQRNRLHVDVTVPHDQAQARVEAAIAAGGTLVSDTAAPSFWVLADIEGNEVCVCTWQGRPGSGEVGSGG